MELNSNYCQIIQKSLTGERAVDEQTFASLAILSERLERLKKLGEGFSDIAFSSAVEKLLKQESTVAVAQGR